MAKPKLTGGTAQRIRGALHFMRHPFKPGTAVHFTFGSEPTSAEPAIPSYSKSKSKNEEGWFVQFSDGLVDLGGTGGSPLVRAMRGGA